MKPEQAAQALQLAGTAFSAMVEMGINPVTAAIAFVAKGSAELEARTMRPVTALVIGNCLMALPKQPGWRDRVLWNPAEALASGLRDSPISAPGGPPSCRAVDES